MVARASQAEIEKNVEQSLWFLAKEGEVYQGIETLMKYFETEQSARLEQMLRYERMYGGKKISGLTPDKYWQTESPIFQDDKRMRRNVVKSAIDALGAEIAQHKPRPLYLTKKGSTKLKKKAEKRTKYVEGQFYKCHVYELMPWAAFDAFRVGTGVLKVYNDGHDVHLDRVHPGELFVVDAETIYGRTLQIFHVKYVAKTEVMALPCVDSKEKIDIVRRAEPVATGKSKGASNGLGEIIRIVESYRLPIKRGKQTVVKGRHAITVSSGDLQDREWKRERLPFAFYRYQKPAFGFWGTGVAEQLTPHQFEINKLLRIVQEATAFCSAPWVLTENGGRENKVVVRHLRNEAGAVIDGGLGKVSVYTPNPIHPVILQMIDQYVAAAFEDVGVSRMSAQQTNELGANASGAAQRELHDRYSRRFILQHQQFDQFALDIAEIIVDEVAELANGGKLPVDVPVGDGIETVDWADIKDGEEMILKCYPTNFFSTTPQSKKQEVIEAIQAGWLSREQGMKQLDFPDMASETALITAYQDNVDRIAGLILDDEQKVAALPKIQGFWPESFDLPALPAMMDRMNRWLKRSQANEDAEEKRLDLMREWIERAWATVKQAKPAQPPPAPSAPPAGAPQQPAAMAA